jgi:hypothetical protein
MMKTTLRTVALGLGLAAATAAFAEVTFYEREDFRGRSFTVAAPVPNFELYGFNDRASSLRVERGYWIFCSEPDFHGICRTFGPGDYLQLPPGLENNISSARLIHARYPYRDRPSWR